MKKLCTFSPWQRVEATVLRELLEREGIACLVRNENLFSAMGEIPFTECFPELWVIDDEIYPRAKLLLDGWRAAGGQKRRAWTCPHCGETHEGQFGACWKCGRPRNQE